MEIKNIYEEILPKLKESVGWPPTFDELTAEQTKFLTAISLGVNPREKLLFLSKELKMIQYEVGEISRELETA